jgi:endonuclease/exonuclease/phosphatase family metal-dependent hydrolase
LFSANALAQQPIKLMTYNLLNYPNGGALTSDTTIRNAAYRVTMQAAQPDILVVEEMNSPIGVNMILNNVLNVNQATYSAGTFNDGPDSDNAIFFKSNLFSFVSNTPIRTALRDISEFKLIYLPTSDTIRIYAAHFKASSGASNEALRAAEVDSLRKVTNALPPNSKFWVCGDFNFYSTNEAAYQKLLQLTANTEGEFYDPITITGVFNNPSFAQYHTQSPRVRAFGGGAIGGLDDRFDFILYSKAVKNGIGVSYQNNSTIAYGNDGNHYNDSINRMPNTAVTQSVANALHDGSDHLPVMATFVFPTLSSKDIGVTAFIAPTVTNCSNTNKSLSVKVKNFNSTAIDFSSAPATITLKVTNPLSNIQTYTANLNSGILASNQDTTIVLTSTYNFSTSGTYFFQGYSSLSGDITASNDTMSVYSMTVSLSQSATISPNGTVSICDGNNQVLQASSGSAYLWSNGAITSSISVNTAGSYFVTVTDINGCSATSSTTIVNVITPTNTGLVFHENMGTVSATTSIATHETNNGFESDSLTMSGTGDVRITATSSGYTDASGGANIFLTNTVGRAFQIAGINTIGRSNLQLSFGLFRSNTAVNGSELQVRYSTDGVNYTSLTLAPITGTSVWTYVTVTGTIPQTSNLRLQFRQNGTTAQYRIDDVSLTYSIKPIVTTPNNTTSFCNGDSLLLTSSSGTNYLWNTGATTNSIYVKSAGNYSVTTDCINSDSIFISSTACSFITLQLQLFLEGYYLSGQVLQPVLYNNGLSTNPNACDSITCELYTSTGTFVTSKKGLLLIDGNVSVLFPSTILGNSYYIVVKSRNTIETWSMLPVLFNNAVINYSFKQ